jgi:hypothetical protein
VLCPTIRPREGRALPGVPVFVNTSMPVSDTAFQRGDDFCGIWHFFELILEDAAGWRPQYSYEQ